MKNDTTGPLDSATHTRAHRDRTRAQALRAILGSDQVVYAIRLSDGTVKIGCTGNLTSRRRQFGKRTQILAFKFGGFEDEQAIHDLLTPHRARGREYYHPTPEVLAVVNDMREGLNLPPIAA